MTEYRAHHYQAIIRHEVDGVETITCQTVSSRFGTPEATAKMLIWQYPMADSIEVKELEHVTK